MQKIEDLAQLKYNLSLGPGYGGYNDLLKALDFTEEELEKYLQFSEERYQRIRLYDSTLIEATLSCWQPGQEGEIHNFNGSVGWFKVLEGTLVLENFDLKEGKPKLKYKQTLKAGEQGFLDDDLGFHRFRNSDGGRAIIFHLYSEKLDERKIYDPHQGLIRKALAPIDKNFDD